MGDVIPGRNGRAHQRQDRTRHDDDRDAESRERAARLRAWVEERFTVHVGRWHDVPVGPHPSSMYQIHFAPDQFPALVPFVMMNRQGLTVLLHPESGRPREDHGLSATWMSEILPLKTEIPAETD